MDPNCISLSVISFIIGLVIKTMLDLEKSESLIKFLSYIPVRGIYRQKYLNISGLWKQEWKTDSKNFEFTSERASQAKIYQFHRYFYGEFMSKNKTYIMFGILKINYLVGRWYDKEDALGYFGSFELEATNSSKLDGMWIGHSKEEHQVKGGDWNWEKEKDESVWEKIKSLLGIKKN